MSSTAETPARGRDLRRLFADNPVVVLTLVFVGLFVATDIVNRVQSSEAFLTPKQVSTTFLYAAILGLMAAGLGDARLRRFILLVFGLKVLLGAVLLAVWPS